MYKSLIKEIANNEIFGIISLVIFAVVFLGVWLYAFAIRKEHVNFLKQLPLEEEDAAPAGQESLNPKN